MLTQSFFMKGNYINTHASTLYAFKHFCTRLLAHKQTNSHTMTHNSDIKCNMFIKLYRRYIFKHIICTTKKHFYLFPRFLYSLSIPHTVSEIVFIPRKSSSTFYSTSESSAKSTGKSPFIYLQFRAQQCFVCVCACMYVCMYVCVCVCFTKLNVLITEYYN